MQFPIFEEPRTQTFDVLPPAPPIALDDDDVVVVVAAPPPPALLELAVSLDVAADALGAPLSGFAPTHATNAALASTSDAGCHLMLLISIPSPHQAPKSETFHAPKHSASLVSRPRTSPFERRFRPGSRRRPRRRETEQGQCRQSLLEISANPAD